MGLLYTKTLENAYQIPTKEYFYKQMISSNKNAVAGLRLILNMMQCFSYTSITTGSAVETNGSMSQCVMIENFPILMH